MNIEDVSQVLFSSWINYQITDGTIKREQPIYSTKAHVFQIDPNTKKKWLPASSQAISVSFYFDSTRKTYRIISVDGSKAVINSTITPNMTFTKTSGKFGQWSDPRAGTVYGLGFSSEADLSNFMEKFKDVKELTKQHHNGDAPSSNPPPPPRSSTAITNGNGNEGSPEITSTNSPHASPKPTVKEERRTSNALNASLPGTSLVEQLKYENDRLKIALAQSSANAKKWEVELQTLKNNNVRLTTALQESTANVEEWKRQLAAYKEDSARLKKKAMEMEASSGGSELLQRQITDMRERVNECEKSEKQKQEEVDDLTRRLSEIPSLESNNRRLEERIKTLEREKEGLQALITEAKKQNDQSQVAHVRDRQQLRALQEQLSTKVGEIYELNDKLADVLKVQSHS